MTRKWKTGQFELAEKIMDQLPVQQRLIIQMRDIEQYEFQEIAKYRNEMKVRFWVAPPEQGKRYGII
jgi:hypothetical protein